ncbi:hypothetical protein [Kribbella speibonae]|uniref:Uncharacterized protein n=1 Tax=Kribbella speibonae TaxID=1572660 RepID=A0A4R0J549_9ACTN|nr:hypothetical protein [Kribbella speibonae]TCC36435.1 hypothetical protein E0H92_27780 [Kribbella speibonae]
MFQGDRVALLTKPAAGGRRLLPSVDDIVSKQGSSRKGERPVAGSVTTSLARSPRTGRSAQLVIGVSIIRGNDTSGSLDASAPLAGGRAS